MMLNTLKISPGYSSFSFSRTYLRCSYLQGMILGRKSEYLRGVTELYTETINQANFLSAVCSAL